MAYNRPTSFRKIFLNNLWPSYRGKRAGRLVRERERVSIKQIAIISTWKVSGRPWFSAPLRCHNPLNCIQITPAPTDAKRMGSPTAYVPSLFVSNVMSLAPKVDELRHAPWEQSLLLSFSLLRRKVGSARIASTLWSRRSPNFWTSQSCFLSSNRFFQCERPFSDKTDGYNWARCTMKNQDGGEIWHIRLGFETVSWQHAAHIQ